MTSSMLRRQLKNLVQNYSEAEVKVREATSNDPWGPSSSQMADISDLTYNVVACNEIMTMLWKRLKDDKNWRHIHKSLTLLEYLLKTGDDRVLLKMKDNVYIVKALTEYRFVEKDGKDQGVNVREKAKVVLVLMEDDEKLREEREFAVKTREKTSKSSAASSAGAIKDPNYRPVYVPGASGLPSLDNIPSVADLAASFAARKEERERQETEKKEEERRAKMSDDELKWEDAGKGTYVKGQAWENEKTEGEVKPDGWRVLEDSKEETDPWGTPISPETFEEAAHSHLWEKTCKTNENEASETFKNQEDPFVVSGDKPDPYISANPSKGRNGDSLFRSSSTDPFTTPKDDPFNTPKDDPFNTPKDDPFNTPKDDPFNTPKDDPFNTPKDDSFNTPKDDPFNTPKDDLFNTPKIDPFNTPKDDPFNTPKDDPFNNPKDDPFNTPKDDPFNTPKDDSLNTSKDESFNTPKDDPFNTLKDDPFNIPKDDPFNTSKDDPFSTSKDDPFSTSKDDPFNTPIEDHTPKDDPFTTPGSMFHKEDPFPDEQLTSTSRPKEEANPAQDAPSTPTQQTENDPFVTAAPMSKKDSFTGQYRTSKQEPVTLPTITSEENPSSAPSEFNSQVNVQATPPENGNSDSFIAQLVSSPQGSADPWAVRSPLAMDSDPWGGGASEFLPTDTSDPFKDTSNPVSDPWVAEDPQRGQVSVPPSDFSPSTDPFGDGSSKGNDPWTTSSTNTTENSLDQNPTFI